MRNLIALFTLLFLATCSQHILENPNIIRFTCFETSQPKAEQSILFISQNKILIIGGHTSSPWKVNKSVELFNLSTGRLEKHFEMKFPHRDQTATLIGHHKALVGGRCPENTDCKGHKLFEILDYEKGISYPISNNSNFYNVNPLPKALVNGKLFISGRCSPYQLGCKPDTIEIFDTNTEKFSLLKYNHLKNHRFEDPYFLAKASKNILLFANFNKDNHPVISEASFKNHRLQITHQTLITEEYKAPSSFIVISTKLGTYILKGWSYSSMENALLKYDLVNHRLKTLNSFEVNCVDFFYKAKTDELYLVGRFPWRGLFSVPPENGLFKYDLKQNNVHFLGHIPSQTSAFNRPSTAINDTYLVISGGENNEHNTLAESIVYLYK